MNPGAGTRFAGPLPDLRDWVADLFVLKLMVVSLKADALAAGLGSKIRTLI